MPKILVTGGCGFIGSNLVNKLLEDENNIVEVIDDLSTGVLNNLTCLNNPRFTFIQGDILFESSLRQLDDQYDVIFHLAAKARIQPSFDEPRDVYEVNSTGTINVLEFAEGMSAPPRVIYASSSSCFYGRYANPYTYTKWLGEQHCTMYRHTHGIPTSVARLYNVYGQNQICTGKYATLIGIYSDQRKQGLPLTITGTGNQKRDFTHVDDVVAGLIAITAQKFGYDCYEFGSGRNYTITEVAEMFKPARIEYVNGRRGEAIATLANITETTQRLNWKPTHSLPDYIADFLSTHGLDK